MSQLVWRPALMMIEAVDMNGEQPRPSITARAISYLTQRRVQVSLPINTQTADVY